VHTISGEPDMNAIKMILLIILLFSANALYAQDKLRILDRGIDGNQRHYLITCPDGSTGGVTIEFELAQPANREDVLRNLKLGTRPYIKTKAPKITQTCIDLEDSEEKCLPAWELEKAALASCSQ
jgi:hypothetical protein